MAGSEPVGVSMPTGCAAKPVVEVSRARDPAGLYFGTRSGDLYGSADDGESWKRIATNLPPILSVRACASA